MDEEISFRNDSDSIRMVRRSNPAVWTSASDDPHIPSAQWIRSAGHPASEGENPHTKVYNQMMIKEV